MAGLKKLIFVRGGRTDEEYPWKFFHLRPESDPKQEPVDLVYFDYPAGKRITWKSWIWQRGKRPPAAKPDEVVDIEPRIQIRNKNMIVDPKSEKYASVLGLYNYLTTQLPNSIVGLHFFTHGAYHGPVLFHESFENVEVDPAQPRDPNDTEPRFRDFFGSNPLAGDEGKKFANALTADALVKLWGCLEERPLRLPVLQYLKAPKGAKGDATRKENLKTYLGEIILTYQYYLTLTLEHIVWATPVGWGTDFSPRGFKYTGRFPPNLDKKELWWHPPNFDQSHRRFYRDVLKAPLDATRYVGYRKGWYDAAIASTTADASSSPLHIDSPRNLQDRLG